MRLRTRYEYQRMLHGSNKFVGQWAIFDIRQGMQSALPKLGITVTRKYGKAHDRNRFKRIVREAFRLTSSSFPPGIIIHVRPRTSSLKALMDNIRSDLLQAFK